MEGAPERRLPPRPRMIVTVDPSLQSAIDALAFPGIAIAHRLISPGDEAALLPEEAPAFAASVVKVRRASGAARIVARELLARPRCPPRAGDRRNEPRCRRLGHRC